MAELNIFDEQEISGRCVQALTVMGIWSQIPVRRRMGILKLARGHETWDSMRGQSIRQRIEDMAGVRFCLRLTREHCRADAALCNAIDAMLMDCELEVQVGLWQSVGLTRVAARSIALLEPA